jgi:hypothetical protein
LRLSAQTPQGRPFDANLHRNKCAGACAHRPLSSAQLRWGSWDVGQATGPEMHCVSVKSPSKDPRFDTLN